MTAPILYQGQRLPFSQLGPGQFELFTYAVFDTALGRRNNLEITTKPPEGADDGFDARAIRISDGKAACLQAKRYQELTLPVVGFELAKIALQSAIDNEPVFSHLIVGASAMQKKLVTALGQSSLEMLIDRATNDAISNPDLEIRRNRVRAKGLDPKLLVKQHFERIRRPDVWSGEMLDQKIGACFSELSDVISRYFKVHVVLQEHPRPDFSEKEYLASKVTFTGPWLDAQMEPSTLPTNVYCDGTSAAVGHPPQASSIRVSGISELLADKRAVLLTAPGGGGKTTSLDRLLADAAQMRMDNASAPLPVLIQLASYRGSTNQLITSRLRLRSGAWQSIPGPKLLLLDGLDRVDRIHLSALSDELDDLLSEPDVQMVLTCRSGGPSFETRVPHEFVAMMIRPPTPREIIVLAKNELGQAASDYLSQLWEAARAPGLLRIPFGIIAALEMYKELRVLPASDRELMERLLEERFSANQKRHSSLPESLAEIPRESVRKVAVSFAFELRVQNRKSTCSTEEFSQLIQTAVAALPRSVIGIERLDSIGVMRLLKHYEIIDQSADGLWQFPHDLYADYLSAEKLAADWKGPAGTLTSESFDDLWSFAAASVVVHEQADFLDAMLQADPVRAARCAKACGQVAHVESAIASLADDSDLYYECNRTARALETLGTEGSEGLLRSLAQHGRSHNSRWTATLALARVGDTAIISRALEDTDGHLCSGISISGSWAHVLQNCSPGRLLNAARSRVSKPDRHPCLSASMDVVATYGSDEDIDSIRLAIDQAPNLPGLAEGMGALYLLSPSAATDHARSLFSEENSPRWVKILMAELMMREGTFDSGAALAELLLSDSPEEDPHELPLQRERLEKLLRRIDPDTVVAALLEKGLQAADDELRGRLFRIAAAHGYRFFVEAARDLLASSNPASARSDALSYLLAVAENRDELESLTDLVTDLCDPCGPRGDTWVFPTALDFVRQLEGSEAAAALLKSRIEHIVEQINTAKDKHSREIWIFSLSPLVDLIAVHAAAMPLSLCTSVLDAPFMHGLTNAHALMKQLVQAHPASAIDDALATMQDDFNRAKFLATATGHGSTPFRRAEVLRLLERPLLAMLAADLATALDHLWHDDLLAEAIDRIIRYNADISPPEVAVAQARPILECFARRVCGHHAEILTKFAARGDCPPVFSSELENLASAARRRG